MALAAGLNAYVAELIANDNPFPASALEASDRFCDAYADFFGYASLGGIPIVTGANLIPGAVQAFKAAMLPAFETSTAAESCAIMQVAILAYINAMPAVAAWPLATSAAIILPLYPVIKPLAKETSNQQTAKLALATGLMNWTMTGIQVTLSAPPGATALIV